MSCDLEIICLRQAQIDIWMQLIREMAAIHSMNNADFSESS